MNNCVCVRILRLKGEEEETHPFTLFQVVVNRH